MKVKIEYLSYILFSISNLLLLFNPGAFWDDWTLHMMDDKGIMSQFYGNGFIFFGYLHIFLKNIWASPILYHLLTFFLQLFSVFWLFRIHEKFNMRKEISLFFLFAILIYAVYPVYDSKITMIVLPYTICLFLFLTAFFFLMKYREKKKRIGFRIFSLLFFFFSFFTNSLLFFYLIPIFLVFFFPFWNTLLNKNKIQGFKTFTRNVFKQVFVHIDFFILPFLFWVVRMIYFIPSQQYASLGYNEIKIESLLEMPYRFGLFAYIYIVSLIPLVKEALQTPEILILTVVIAFFVNRKFLMKDFDFRVSWRILIWGLGVLIIGSFPYLLVGKLPSYINYSSRNQLLIGFGICIIITGFIFLLKSAKLKKVFFSLGIGLFVSFTIFLHFSFFKGYVKQVVYQDFFFSKLPVNKESKTILLKDYTADFTQKGNPSKFYAFAGMLKKKYSSENIVIIPANDLQWMKENNVFSIISPYLYQYNLSHYKYKEPKDLLEVDYSRVNRPTFPLVTYYGDFVSGNKDKWQQYFQFRIKPIDISTVNKAER